MMVIAVVGLTVALPVTAQELLRSGDKLQLSILGVPQSGGPVTISAAGTASFPYVGSIEASGKSIPQLNDEIELGLINQKVTIVQPDGGTLVVSLSGADFFLQLIEKAPVIIDGFVAQPGAVPYQPRMTPRQAIALAGGLGTSQLASTISPVQLLQINVSIGEAMTDIAQNLVDLWMVDALLAGDPDLPFPDGAGNIPNMFLEGLVEAARAEVSERLDTLKAETTFQLDRGRVIEARQEILKSQIEVARLQLEQAQAESDRLEEMEERGLVPLQRLQAEQRALTDASATLLNAEEDLTSADLQRLDAERIVAEAEEKLRAFSLEMRSRARAEMTANRSKLEALRSLAMAAGLSDTLGATGFVPNVAVYRDGQIVADGADAIDFDLFSGDYVVVSFEESGQ